MKSRVIAACLLFVGLPACACFQARADRASLEYNACWVQRSLSRANPVDAQGFPLTGDRLEERRAWVAETIERNGIDCSKVSL